MSISKSIHEHWARKACDCLWLVCFAVVLPQVGRGKRDSGLDSLERTDLPCVRFRSHVRTPIQGTVCMNTRVVYAGLFVVAIYLAMAGEARPWEESHFASLSVQIREVIRERLRKPGAHQRIVCSGELICASEKLQVFYESRLFRPVWSDDDGTLPIAGDFIQEVQYANQEGLRAADYHLHTLNSLLENLRNEEADEEPPSPDKFADLDLLLTDAFLMYASHLVNGKANPETFQVEWYVEGRKADPASLLDTALQTNLVGETLRSLHPPYPGYARLRQALAHYRILAESGGWEPIPSGESMRMGDSGSRIAALKRRLMVSGDLSGNQGADAEVFDRGLEDAVKRFQARHGLAPDGIVGPFTLAAFNVPASKRVTQIESNMERWRWLPQTLGVRYVTVNIANFELEVRDGARVIMGMRAIVGTPYQRTPVFSAKMTYIVLNPHWNIPSNIVKEEMLPEIHKSPDYLSKNRIKIFTNWDGKRTEVDPTSIDWPSVSPDALPFLFRQEAGPENPLGRIKFIFPNKFEIYLHDTPSRHLFRRITRQFSHGCIRIEKPVELAEYLLRGDLQWTKETLAAALESQVDKTVRLPEPVDVHILYWTAWVDKDETLQFREDIYDRDTPLARALEQGTPRP